VHNCYNLKYFYYFTRFWFWLLFKIEDSGPYNEIKFPPTIPHISFAGKDYARPEERENDCKFGVNLIEYNNFNFGNKEKMNFKMQVVYDAGPTSRFRRLAPKLEIEN